MVQLLTALPSSSTVHAPQMRGFAADVRAGEARHFAQVVDQEQPRLDFVGIGFSVDGESDLQVRPPGPRSARLEILGVAVLKIAKSGGGRKGEGIVTTAKFDRCGSGL